MEKYEQNQEILEKWTPLCPETPGGEERNRDARPEREPRKRSVGVMPPQPVPIRPRRSAMFRFNQWLALTRFGYSFRLMLWRSGWPGPSLALIINEYVPGMPWLAQLVALSRGFCVCIADFLIRFFAAGHGRWRSTNWHRPGRRKRPFWLDQPANLDGRSPPQIRPRPLGMTATEKSLVIHRI